MRVIFTNKFQHFARVHATRTAKRRQQAGRAFTGAMFAFLFGQSAGEGVGRAEEYLATAPCLGGPRGTPPFAVCSLGARRSFGARRLLPADGLVHKADIPFGTS